MDRYNLAVLLQIFCCIDFLVNFVGRWSRTSRQSKRQFQHPLFLQFSENQRAAAMLSKVSATSHSKSTVSLERLQKVGVMPTRLLKIVLALTEWGSDQCPVAIIRDLESLPFLGMLLGEVVHAFHGCGHELLSHRQTVAWGRTSSTAFADNCLTEVRTEQAEHIVQRIWPCLSFLIEVPFLEISLWRFHDDVHKFISVDFGPFGLLWRHPGQVYGETQDKISNG